MNNQLSAYKKEQLLSGQEVVFFNKKYSILARKWLAENKINNTLTSKSDRVIIKVN